MAKVNFSLVCLGVFSGFSETKNGKSEIYFGFGAFVVLLSSSLGRWWCPPSAGGALLLPLFGCVPSLLSPPFVRFPALLAVSLANMALFRVLRGFLARFGARMYVCMG